MMSFFGIISNLDGVVDNVSFKIKYEQYKKEIEDKRGKIKKKIQEQKSNKNNKRS